MEKIVFSIIITSYNQPQEIKRAIDSVLIQKEKCFEIIVVDDCSTDETLHILNQYEEKYSNVQIIRHLKNSSSHVARCSGVEKAKGLFTIFLDGDDYLFPNALQKLLFQVINVENDFDVCEYSYQCQPDGEIEKPHDFNINLPRIEYYLNPESSVTVWNKLYKTEILKKAFSKMQKKFIRCGDDTYESICIAYFTKNFIQKDVLITNYSRTNGVSIRKNTFESNCMHCESLKSSLDCLIDFFEKNNYPKSELLLEITEKKFFTWILSVMKNNTVIDDITKSLLLLPKYFPNNLLLPYFNSLYSSKIKILNLKNLIKSFFKYQ